MGVIGDWLPPGPASALRPPAQATQQGGRWSWCWCEAQEGLMLRRKAQCLGGADRQESQWRAVSASPTHSLPILFNYYEVGYFQLLELQLSPVHFNITGLICSGMGVYYGNKGLAFFKTSCLLFLK